MSLDEKYLGLVDDILTNGWKKENRTGVAAYTVAGRMIDHDMSEGFPLLTTKKVAYKNAFSEMEFFIKGITDKKWLQERNNHIWDEWAWQKKVPYGNDAESKKKMFEERDLGPVYGFQWRHFGAEYKGYDANYEGQGIDQLVKAIEKVKKSPGDRRILVSAWNPSQLDEMGLPPCHYAFQLTVTDQKINLICNMRSIDTMLGLPFNLAGYGFLLELFAKETNYQPGRLMISLGDLHIYENHLEGAKEQLSRKDKVFSLPHLDLGKFTSILTYDSRDAKIKNYESHPKIEFPIAV